MDNHQLEIMELLYQKIQKEIQFNLQQVKELAKTNKILNKLNKFRLNQDKMESL